MVLCLALFFPKKTWESHSKKQSKLKKESNIDFVQSLFTTMSNNKTSEGNGNSRNVFSPCFKSHLFKIDFIFLYWYFKICVITEGVLSDNFFKISG